MESKDFNKVIDQITEQTQATKIIFESFQSPLQKLMDQFAKSPIGLLDSFEAEEKRRMQLIKSIAIPDWNRHFVGKKISELLQFSDQLNLQGLKGLMGCSSEYEKIRTTFEQLSGPLPSPTNWQLLAEGIGKAIPPISQLDRILLGLSGISKIGSALNRVQLLDDQTAEMLRPQLGDWRQIQAIPLELLLDDGNRSTFYTERGFNINLSSLPRQTFYDATEFAQIRGSKADYSEKNQTNFPDADVGIKRASAAHPKLVDFERKLRKFIDQKMTSVFGKDWAKQRLPEGILDQWKKNKATREKHSNSDDPLIDFSDFTHYLVIIVRNDNWKEVFESYFQRKETVQESFFRLYPVRNCVMHSRPINQDDELFLFAELRRLLRAIGD